MDFSNYFVKFRCYNLGDFRLHIVFYPAKYCDEDLVINAGLSEKCKSVTVVSNSSVDKTEIVFTLNAYIQPVGFKPYTVYLQLTSNYLNPATVIIRTTKGIIYNYNCY